MRSRTGSQRSATSGVTRRRFLELAASAAAGLATVTWPRRYWAQSGPRVVIVGGGIAGLTTAYRLWSRYGIAAQVFEAQPLVGGRVSTIRNVFSGGQFSERGGTFVSTGDRYIRRLARKLAVPMLDTNRVYPSGDAVYRFLGTNFSYDDLTANLWQVEDAAVAALDEIEYPPRFDNTSSRTEFWDQMSVADWLDQSCPGGIGSPLGRYLRLRFETDIAGPAAEASALQIILDLAGPGGNSVFDERFLFANGSDSLVDALVGRLPNGSVTLNQPLQRLVRNLDGSVRCEFASAVADADYLVLALPFTVLRTIDYSSLGFDSRKDEAIQNLGMGSSAKLHFQFDGAPWQPSHNGESASDATLGATWQATLEQGDSHSILVAFNGVPWSEQYGSALPHAVASPAVVSSHLAAVETIFPGASSAYAGIAYLDHWNADPWVKGSYSFYKTGQMTGFRGIEGSKQGNVYFAGEHTSLRNSGTMDGAVESGERVAKEVIRDIRRA